jgi:hypothetical protein
MVAEARVDGSTLRDHLLTKRSVVIGRWKELVAATYPDDYAQFLGRERDRFDNPVGHAVGQSVESLFDGILAGRETSELLGAVDEVVRIRAVQDFSASQAVSFLFLLKRIIRDELAGAAGKPTWPLEALELEARIDALALAAFDIYVLCRERIFQLRADELKRSTHQLLKRVRGVVEETGTESGSPVKGVS